MRLVVKISVKGDEYWIQFVPGEMVKLQKDLVEYIYLNF